MLFLRFGTILILSSFMLLIGFLFGNKNVEIKILRARAFLLSELKKIEEEHKYPDIVELELYKTNLELILQIFDDILEKY